MKKRFVLTTLLFAALFALCMSAYAATPVVYVGGVGLEPGEYLAVNGSDGVTSKPTGGYAHLSADGTTLTLDNYSYEGEGHNYAAIYANQALNIVLEGENRLKCTNTSGIAIGIFVENGNVTISGDGSLDIDADFGIYTN
ncbi:MAG: hypothetical protein IKM07_00780, partial [Clostridia bacterium]|nr:hypothetical protein [Clostridia bacterium]